MTGILDATPTSKLVQRRLVRTSIPGPRSRALHEEREGQVPRGFGVTMPVFVERADGGRADGGRRTADGGRRTADGGRRTADGGRRTADGGIILDVDGNQLIDLASGIAVTSVGASHPAVVAAVAEQADRFTHTCFMVTEYTGFVDVAQALNRPTPRRPREAHCPSPPGRRLSRTRSRSPALPRAVPRSSSSTTPITADSPKVHVCHLTDEEFEELAILTLQYLRTRSGPASHIEGWQKLSPRTARVVPWWKEIADLSESQQRRLRTLREEMSDVLAERGLLESEPGKGSSIHVSPEGYNPETPGHTVKTVTERGPEV